MLYLNRSITAALMAAVAAFAVSMLAASAGEVPAADTLALKKMLQVAVEPSMDTAVAFRGDDKYHAAYELFVSNYTSKPIRIVALKVAGVPSSAAFSATIAGKQLDRSFSTIDRQVPPVAILKPGEAGVLFVFVDFAAADKIPAKLIDLLDVEVSGQPDTLQEIVTRPIDVNKDGAVVIHSPLAGANWIAMNGPSNSSVHRRALLVVDGNPAIGQRFAIDWVKLDQHGATYHGDPLKNSSYYAYDAPIMAAADGTIVSVTDGIPENTPDPIKRAVELDLHNVGGNNVIEDLGGARFALYAHLKTGSITVKAGDSVCQGQLLARLGNTGNSTEPHLHFQVCDAPSFIASSGIPFELNSFTLIKHRIDQKNGQPVKLTVEEQRQVLDQTPMDDELVSFDGK